jgi:hypothetical protein
MPPNAIIDDNGGPWTFRFDVVEDGIPIRQCKR